MGDYDDLRRSLVDPIWRQVGRKFIETAVERGLLEISDVAAAEEFLAAVTGGWEAPGPELLGDAPLQVEELGSFAVSFAFECEVVEEIYATNEQLWTLMASLIRSTSFPTEADIDAAYDLQIWAPAVRSPELAAHERTAWKPIVESTDEPSTASKFGGTPYLGRADDWPICPNCDFPMQLFVQLNLSEIPQSEQDRLGNTGLIQLFYCTTFEPPCEVDCEAYFPFAKSVVARFVEVIDPGVVVEAAELAEPFPAKRIVGWEALEDYPNWEELTYNLGVDHTPDDEIVIEAIGAPHPGDKLGGWPHWIQGVEYPGCRECGSQMELVFQIDSEDNLPYMFGDSGAGHLTRCPKHPHILTFAWACC